MVKNERPNSAPACIYIWLHRWKIYGDAVQKEVKDNGVDMTKNRRKKKATTCGFEVCSIQLLVPPW